MAMSFNRWIIILVFRLFVLLCFAFNLSLTFAQDSLSHEVKEDFGGFVDLDRGGKIALKDIENESILSLGLDSTGLGVLNAFFARQLVTAKAMATSDG